jgi:glycosyltransferase involved in cell wall biosynthesis
VAIDAARAAKVPILLGGTAHPGDREYFDREVAPRLLLPSVTALGEVGGRVKRDIFAGASALLFPIDWEEPFGLVMIEAMLSGTPVLAFARGSVPEIVEDGVTGYLCRDHDEMAARLRRISALDRARVRERAVERFSASRMVRDYLSIYQQLVRVEDVRAASTVA